jgi:hypothetical protein
MKMAKLLFVLFSMLSITSHCLQAMEKDNEVVNYIKKETNLTKADVKKWKLFWLGSAANPLDVGLGFYTIYQAGKFGYYAPTNYEQKITNIVKSLNIPALFANKFESLAKNKYLWAAVGAYSADYIWGRLITLRIPWYYMGKIERFLKFCQPLSFAHKKCNDTKEFVQAIPDRTWCRYGVIALQRGFDNLIDQADVAYELLDQLKNAGIKGKEESISVMQDKVLAMKNNIMHNKMFITEESVQLCSKKLTGPESALEAVLTLIFFPWILMFKHLSDY